MKKVREGSNLRGKQSQEKIEWGNVEHAYRLKEWQLQEKEWCKVFGIERRDDIRARWQCSFIQLIVSLNKYRSSTCYMSYAVLGAEDTVFNNNITALK